MEGLSIPEIFPPKNNMNILRKQSLQSDEYFDSASRPSPIVEEILALIKYRELVYQFVSRSIKTRYKRSVLGVFWTLLNPLLTMIVLTIIFSQVFRFSVDNYPIYVLCGLVIWNFYSNATSGAMSDMLWSGSLLGRIYMPKSVFAVSAIGTGLINLLISLIPVFIIALVLRVQITPAILVMPFSVFLLAIFSLGFGLAISTAAVFFGDMEPVYNVLLMIWFYATPIIYPIDVIPEQFQWLIRFNPLFYFLTIFREPLYNGTVPDLSFWVISSLLALGMLVIGAYTFTSRTNEYAYRI
jgi:ABC-type polysaccharide/polyol phosphate export permease